MTMSTRLMCLHAGLYDVHTYLTNTELLTSRKLFYVGAESSLVLRPADGSNQVFPDPGNIIVGFASDLTLQIQCLCTNETVGEMITWQYQNGTEVPMGLEAFGVSQDVGGVLQVHPVSELMDENLFRCSNGNGTDLNVTFSLGEFIRFD